MSPPQTPCYARGVSEPLRPGVPSARPRGALRVALLVVLVLAAALSLLGQPRIIAAVRQGALPPEWLLVAPGLFVVFVVVSVVDVVLLARRRGFMSGRSLLQVAFSLAFLAMLTPQAYFEYRARKAPPVTSPRLLEELAQSRDARVRALVMEVAGARVSEAGTAALLTRGLDDVDPLVREAAVRAVAHATGTPLEGEDRLEAARRLVEAWRAKEAAEAAQP